METAKIIHRIATQHPILDAATISIIMERVYLTVVSEEIVAEIMGKMEIPELNYGSGSSFQRISFCNNLDNQNLNIYVSFMEYPHGLEMHVQADFHTGHILSGDPSHTELLGLMALGGINILSKP